MDDLSLSDGDFMDDHVKFKPKMVSKPPIASSAIFCIKVSHDVSVSVVVCKAYQSTSEDNPMMSMVKALVSGDLSCMALSFNQSALWSGMYALYLPSRYQQIFLTNAITHGITYDMT